MALLLLISVTAVPQAMAAADNTLIVTTKKKAKIDEIRQKLTAAGCSVIREIPFSTGKFTIFHVSPNNGDAAAAMVQIDRIKGVNTVERNFQSTTQASAFCSVNDPDFPSQYGLQNVRWNEARCTLKLLGINQRATPRLTLIDSGCNRINSGDELTDVTQFNFVGGVNGVQEAPFDPGVHGTAVCAIVSARSDNSTFIAGVGSHNLPVKVVCCRCSGDGTTYATVDVIQAMAWCMDNQALRGGPGVINVSLNSFGLPKYNGSPTIQEIAREGRKQGDLMVNASGNEGPLLVDNSPEKYMRRVLAVDENNILAPFSNTGPFVAAGPGVAITTFDSPSSIAFGHGTSYASQFWTGAICLLMSLNPRLNAVEADAIVFRTAQKTSQGYKVPDINKAVLQSALFTWF